MNPNDDWYNDDDFDNIELTDEIIKKAVEQIEGELWLERQLMLLNEELK